MSDFDSDLAIHGIEIATANIATDTQANTTDITTKLPKVTTALAETRALDAPFQVSADYLSWVSYTVQCDNSFSIAGTKTSTVELLIDELTTPVTSRGKLSLGGTVAAILSLLGLTDQTVTTQLSGWVEPGHNVLLATSGTGTVTLINQEERVFSG